jgi:poly-beta-1,6-N-acetyl-D-glucosamine synthase
MDLWFIENTDLITKLILAIFIVSFFIQIFYYLFIFSASTHRSIPLNPRKKKYPPVSVIICARDEAENLKKFLSLILEQDYPDFEVIVVNDCSEDDTEIILNALQKKYAHLKVSTIKKDPVFSHGKKLALTVGIKAANNELLLLTDADCYPSSALWIKYMMRNFDENTDITLGIGLYEKKPGILNMLIRFETAFIAMQYISLARRGKPYMGIGRNLAYKKDLFFKNKGFGPHNQLSSGDDDLFINKTAYKQNTLTETDPNSFTYSIPELKWKNWVRQKKRHLTTGKFYQQSTKRILGFEFISRFLLNLCFIIALFKYNFTGYLLAVYLLQLIIKAIVYNIAFRRLNEKYLFLPSLIIEPLIPLFYGVLHISNFFGRKRNIWI